MSRSKKKKGDDAIPDAPADAVTPEIRALFDQVYEDPDDDSARIVLSDALIERRDPRGEFIALQLGRGRGVAERREWKLLRQFQEKWLGRIAASARSPVFERGFLARCRFVPLSSVAANAIGAREWATVRVVNVDGAGDVAPLLLSEPIRMWTRTVEGLHGASASAVLKSTLPRRWRALTMRTEDVNGIIKLAIDTLVMPELRTLDIACDRSLRSDLVQDLLNAPLGKQLSELSFTTLDSNAALTVVKTTTDLFLGAQGPTRIGLAGIAGSIMLDTQGERAGHVSIGMIRDPTILASSIESLKGSPIRSIRIVKSRPAGYYGAPQRVTDADMEKLRKVAEKIGPVTMESIP